MSVKTHAKGPQPVPVAEEQHLTTTLWERSESTDAILSHHVNGEWQYVSWSELADRVRGVATGLIASGVESGDRVALMASTSVEWTVCDLAILAAGGVTVPIYDTSSPDQCAWILSNSGAKLAFAGDADAHGKQLELARDEAKLVKDILVLGDGALDVISEKGRKDQEALRTLEERQKALSLGVDATIIYTSGTTGPPKGCVLTHGNILWTAHQAKHRLGDLFVPGQSTLLFLPLAHSFARLIQFGCLEAGAVIGYARSIDDLAEDLRGFKPTFLLSVPRVFEKVFNSAQSKATGAKRKIFDFSVATAQSGDRGIKHKIADKLVYSKLREAVGGRVRYAVSGGAPLSPHLAHFFDAAGMRILEGYGLTETSAPATVNTPTECRIGTVGKPLPGVEIRIDPDGEILISGGNIFQEYWKNPEATDEILDDGWLRTGDIGELDDDGYLSITGRKKEIIVTAGGKNVSPAVLEERLKSHRLISQAMVVGDDRPFIAALVTLDPDEAQAFAKRSGLSSNIAELTRNEQVRSQIQEAVDHANEAVSRAEAIKKFTILERDFSEQDGEVTPTMKVRRAQVAQHFADAIEDIYSKR